jgi:hypothetical protein
MTYGLECAKPIPGRSWPIGRDDLDDALDRAGAHPRHVSYSHTPEEFWSERSGGPVAEATYFAEGRHQASAGSVYVYIYSVPSHVRAQLVTAVGAALERLAEWVSAASERDSGWRMFDHSLQIVALLGEKAGVEVREDWSSE